MKKRMNKKGSTVFLMLMLGILLFVLGMALAKPMGDVTSESMNNAQLNCSNTTLTQADEAVCTQIDIMQPFLVGSIFGLAGLLLGRIFG